MRLLENIEKKKVLILGFGREGLSTYKYLRKKYPDKKLAIADVKDINNFDIEIIKLINKDIYLNYHLGKDFLKFLELYEIVIKTPGISHKLKEINDAKKKGIEFTSQTNIFLNQCKGKIIGITGTKGKSTTTSLVYHILQEAKIESILVGNIGKPPLDCLSEGDRNTFFVFEMSSHQLMDIETSPHIAIILNIFPEHLDYYSNYEEYKNAKFNITKYQNNLDYLIYCTDFSEIGKFSNKTKSQKYSFSTIKQVDRGCFIKNEMIVFRNNNKVEFIIQSNKIPLKGKHNLNNTMAAIIASHIAGASFETISKAIQSFNPLEGRLENVGIFDSKYFVNDTLATIPEATISAIEAFKDKEITLILGGFDRGLSFNKLGIYLAKNNNVKNVVLIGQTALKIKETLNYHKFKGQIHNLGKSKMSEVVKLASNITNKNGIILLSPASTSFDMFKDYKDRGDQFKKEVLELSK